VTLELVLRIAIFVFQLWECKHCLERSRRRYNRQTLIWWYNCSKYYIQTKNNVSLEHRLYDSIL